MFPIYCFIFFSHFFICPIIYYWMFLMYCLFVLHLINMFLFTVEYSLIKKMFLTYWHFVPYFINMSLIYCWMILNWKDVPNLLTFFLVAVKCSFYLIFYRPIIDWEGFWNLFLIQCSLNVNYKFLCYFSHV